MLAGTMMANNILANKGNVLDAVVDQPQLINPFCPRECIFTEKSGIFSCSGCGKFKVAESNC